MGGYTPIAITFTPFEISIEELCTSTIDYLTSANDMQFDVETAASRLVFDAHTSEWTETVAIDGKNKTIEALATEYHWLRVDVDLRIGDTSHDVEIYFFPISPKDKKISLMISLGSRPYEMLYDPKSPDEDDDVNENIKRSLVQLCCSLAARLDATGFMLGFDDGQLHPLLVEDLIERLQRPELTLHGRKPGLLTGLKTTVISLSELEKVWGTGEELYENIAGYVILDSL